VIEARGHALTDLIRVVIVTKREVFKLPQTPWPSRSKKHCPAIACRTADVSWPSPMAADSNDRLSRQMDEIRSRIDRYNGLDLVKILSTFDGLIQFSTRFYVDVAEIYDSITRIRTSRET
jgi:hypothetical protein